MCVNGFTLSPPATQITWSPDQPQATSHLNQPLPLKSDCYLKSPSLTTKAERWIESSCHDGGCNGISMGQSPWGWWRRITLRVKELIALRGPAGTRTDKTLTSADMTGLVGCPWHNLCTAHWNVNVNHFYLSHSTVWVWCEHILNHFMNSSWFKSNFVLC